MAIIAPSGTGKTYLIEGLILMMLPETLDPVFVGWEQLEAVKTLESLRCGGGPTQPRSPIDWPS